MAVAVVMKQNLEEQLEQAKECLKDLDANIKKLTGRDPNELRPGMRRGPMGPGGGGGGGGGGGLEARGRDRIITMGNRRDAGGMMDGPPAKRRALGGPFNRLGPRTGPRVNRGEDSGDDDDLPHKPTVQSSIVATPKEMKSRKDCLEEQKSDSRGLARNRRMFGLLLGTLQKFKDEETIKKEKETKRIEIEKKLEAAAEKEKEESKRERQELFLERRKRQANLRRLEHQMEVVKQHDEWELHQKNLLFFIQTKTKPSIFYLPGKHTLVTEERLKDSKKRVEALITERRAQMAEELQAMEQNRMPASEQQADIAEEVEVEMEEEPVLKDEEENDVIIGETEMKEDDDRPVGVVPESGNDLAAVDLNQTLEEGEVPSKEETNEKKNGDDVEMVVVKEEVETKTELDIEKQTVDSGMKTEDPEIFTKDQSLLTEKEFEPIYD
uniref:Pinin n=1 Tax=Strigamia maritima TaxID=126957 RepID=T1JJ15_STRMM